MIRKSCCRRGPPLCYASVATQPTKPTVPRSSPAKQFPILGPVLLYRSHPCSSNSPLREQLGFYQSALLLVLRLDIAVLRERATALKVLIYHRRATIALTISAVLTTVPVASLSPFPDISSEDPAEFFYRDLQKYCDVREIAFVRTKYTLISRPALQTLT